MDLIKLFFFVLASFHRPILSQNTFNTSVIPITKDAKTSLHKISLSFAEPRSQDYLIDLDAPFTWRDCVMRNPRGVACGLEEGCRFPLSCDNTLCKEAHSYTNPICPSLNITAKYGCKICAVTPFNPISKSCKISQFTTDLIINWYETNGWNPSTSVYYPFGKQYVLSCAPSSLLKSFPKGVRGVASFSRSALAFPSQMNVLTSENKFALCLPSSSSGPGVIFLGDGPFYFTTNPNLDLRAFLAYTPMIRTDPKSLGYYFRLNRIIVKGKTVALPSIKNSFVKLSTVVPYTTLRSDIYKEFIASFSKAAIFIPQVNAVQPFSLCYKSIVVGPGSMWWRVPKIDLETENGQIWRISGDNSMKYMGNGVSCLAFLDGGSGVKDAIVIGTHQMENNFLFFDLENQSLGFTSSLLSRGTSCSSFNFTRVPE